MNKKPILFISYSHHDDEWFDRIKVHLNVLFYQGFCEIWSDRKISGGQNLDKIFEVIGQCGVAVLLISPYFLSSDFINRKEIPILLERRKNEGVHIYPIIIRPCSWKHVDWLNKMLIRPKDGSPLSLGDSNQIDIELASIVDELGDIFKQYGVDITTIHDQDMKESYRPSPLDSIRTKTVDILKL